MNTPISESQRLFELAQGLMPGGVNSPVRAFCSVGGTPRFIQSAQGCLLTDVDGNRYIDYVGSWGAMIAGHAASEVVRAVEETLRRGTSFGTPTMLEVELAQEIVARVPSVEKVRMVNSGTEAVMSAIRLARAATGRNKIVKFAGCYHGHFDSLLVQAGSGVATLGLPDSPGVPCETVCHTLTADFNDLDSVQALFKELGTEIAAVLVEPVAGNMGVVPPAAGFLSGLREITVESGALLVFDEVMTGFRVSRGGAQELYGVMPDLTTFGKVIGGGVPVGAYGGSKELMAQIAPEGAVYQAGTLSGNPLAMAAGLATLRLLDEDTYRRLELKSARLKESIDELLRDAEIQAVVQRVGSMLTLFFDTKAVRCFSDAARANHARFADFFQNMLRHGVHLPPSGYEAWFLSLAHDDAVVEATLEAVRKSLHGSSVHSG
ncbi:MAG: glutamate-1-semialdehyde 2,1-aminomutase [Phycisphaerales bacterium]|nr:glutamate-1-semialdehyde 2,1-aminomutase [Phycisphaerales bacterium]